MVVAGRRWSDGPNTRCAREEVGRVEGEQLAQRLPIHTRRPPHDQQQQSRDQAQGACDQEAGAALVKCAQCGVHCSDRSTRSDLKAVQSLVATLRRGLRLWRMTGRESHHVTCVREFHAHLWHRGVTATHNLQAVVRLGDATSTAETLLEIGKALLQTSMMDALAQGQHLRRAVVLRHHTHTPC